MKVSVVLPTYNRAYILPRAIRSILEQTYKNFELLIVDDGSNDNTEDVVRSFSDARIRYVRHSHNRGLAAARNTGVYNSSGFYIANLDSDDIWEKEKLAREVAALSRAPARVGVAYSKIKKKMPDGRIIYVPGRDIHNKEGNLYKEILSRNFITMQAALMKRECFERVNGFDESLPALQDWDFWLRVSQYFHFIYIDKVGVIVTVLPDSITANQKKRLLARTLIFGKHERRFLEYPRIYAHLAYVLGHTYALQGKTEIARNYIKKSFNTRLMFKNTVSYMLLCVGGARLYSFITRLFVRGKTAIYGRN